MIEKLTKLIKKHEGLSLKPYTDTQGFLTIGYGRNLSSKGISKREAEVLLANDIDEAMHELYKVLPNVFDWPEDAKIAIIDMMFNLGSYKFRKFKRMIEVAKRNDFEAVAREMLDSLWARQVGYRAEELARMVKDAGEVA